MHSVIDTPWNTISHLGDLKSAGVRVIVRYYNRANSSKLPEKRIEEAEARAISDAGMKLAVVYQQRGGKDGHIEDLDAASGAADAARSLELADRIGQPDGSAIYFAVDWDYFHNSHLDSIQAYFAAAKKKLDGKFRLGVYGSGTVSARLRDAGLVDYIWLPAATGWSGTKDMLKTDAWAIYQKWPPVNLPLPHDGNIQSAAWSAFGEFVPFSEPTATDNDNLVPFERAPDTVLMEVTARSGLRLRRGPSTSYDIEAVVSLGTVVRALGQSGDWFRIDVEGDGNADGYMHGGYLRVVSGGFPADAIAGSPMTIASPYSVAQAELARDVREVPGPGNNPRIVMYHNTTQAWSGTDDSVAWCSSFVNYCVEQAGLLGTGSQSAQSWKDWGHNVMDDPREGDIVVWRRGADPKGHVGFYYADQGDRIAVLGGNQSNRIRISSYPKDGKLKGTHYKLLAIRRV